MDILIAALLTLVLCACIGISQTLNRISKNLHNIDERLSMFAEHLEHNSGKHIE